MNYPFLNSFYENRLDNQISTNAGLVWRVVLVTLTVFAIVVLAVLGFHQFQLSDPYTQSVLALRGNAQHGYEIFQMNCAGCHGSAADGRVGPSLHGVSERKSEISLIRQVISGQTPPMPQFQPTPQEMADLLNYLESL